MPDYMRQLISVAQRNNNIFEHCFLFDDPWVVLEEAKVASFQMDNRFSTFTENRRRLREAAHTLGST